MEGLLSRYDETCVIIGRGGGMTSNELVPGSMRCHWVGGADDSRAVTSDCLGVGCSVKAFR